MGVLVQQTGGSNSYTMYVFTKCLHHVPFKWAVLPIHLDKPDKKYKWQQIVVQFIFPERYIFGGRNPKSQ